MKLYSFVCSISNQKDCLSIIQNITIALENVDRDKIHAVLITHCKIHKKQLCINGIRYDH